MDHNNINNMTAQEKREALAKILKSKVAAKSVYPLSSEQLSMWFQQNLDLTSTAFNIALAFCLHGKLNRQAVVSAVNEIVARHDTLRSVILMKNDLPVQKVQDKKDVEIKISKADFRAEGDWQEKVLALSAKQSQQPFNFAKGPLYRFELVQIEEELNVLLFTVHHIIFDGWSIGVFLKEFSDLYVSYTEGTTPKLEVLPKSFGDFVRRQRKRSTDAVVEEQLKYWQSRLSDIEPTLELPTDHARPSIVSTQGAIVELPIDRELTSKLDSLGKRHEATFFMTMLATFYVLLGKLSGQKDIVLGVATANRNEQDSWGLLGLFSNVLPMRASFGEDPSFLSFLNKVKHHCLSDYDNADVAIASIVEAVNPDRDPSRNILFQAGFDFQNTPWPTGKVTQYVTLLSGDNGASKLDLNLNVSKLVDRLVVAFEYNSSLFSQDTMQSFASCYEQLLKSIVENPNKKLSQFDIISDTGRAKVLESARGESALPRSQNSVYELVYASISRSPTKTAIVSGDDSITYAQLDLRINQLSQQLQANGVRQHDRVGLYFERSVDYIASLFAVWKLGACYVPLDPKLPFTRIDFIIKDAGISQVLTNHELSLKLQQHEMPCAWLVADEGQESGLSSQEQIFNTRPEDLAYIIYTSGTTGTPKGVMIPHSCLCHYAHNATEKFSLNSEDKVLQFSSISFDTSCEEIFPSLISGASLYLRNEEMIATMDRFLDEVDRNKLTVINLPTSFWNELVAYLSDESVARKLPAAVKLVIIGGEAAPLHLVNKWLEMFGKSVRLLNTYGPTETTVSATTAELSELAVAGQSLDRVPIGLPNAGMYVYILDESNQVLPHGLYGEIVIGGPTVGKGYWNRTELTAEKFIDNPFNKDCSFKLYKTGDYGRYLNNGQIEYRGRVDNQIKFRGYRIETSEIEAILLQHPAITHCAVLLLEGEASRLVAYIAHRSKEDSESLRAWMSAHCPEYMIPTQFVFLDSMPLNTSNKIDRQKLILTTPEMGQESEQLTPPRNSQESTLLGIWCDVLGHKQIDINANFFKLGGHSLLITKMLSRIKQLMSIQLPLSSVFVAPTVALLSEYITEHRRKSDSDEVQLPLQRVDRTKDGYQLSFAQRRLWFIDQLNGSSLQYQIPQFIKITGEFDEAIAEVAFQRIIERHESLRTVYQFDEETREVYQSVLKGSDFKLTKVNLLDMPQANRQKAIDEVIAQDLNKPFALDRDLMFRATAIRTEKGQVILVTNSHHIASDGWSLGIIYAEFIQQYQSVLEGKVDEILPLPIQYIDYAHWQNKLLSGKDTNKQLAYWQNKLNNIPVVHELPLDYERPALQTFNGDSVEFFINKATLEQLKKLAVDNQMTLYMVLYAAFSILISRYSNKSDVVIGTPNANRSQKELEAMVGLFVDTLVLRVDCDSKKSTQDFFQEVKSTVLDAHLNKDIPFEMIVEHLNPVRSTQYSPVIQIMFGLNLATNTTSSNEGFSFERYEETDVSHSTAQFDLSLDANEVHDGVSFNFEYNTDLFSCETITRMSEHYQNILNCLLGSAESLLDIKMLSDTEEQNLSKRLKGSLLTTDKNSSVCQLFEKIAMDKPDSKAVVYQGETVSYKEVNDKSNQLARYLISTNETGNEVLVGVCLEPSIDWVITVLAIFKAGGVYFPIEANQPEQRKSKLLRRAAPNLLVVHEKTADDFTNNDTCRTLNLNLIEKEVEAESVSNLENSKKDLEQLAYVIFTSGSTGEPKGVMVEHKALAMHITGMVEQYQITNSDRILSFSSIGFDPSLEQLFMALASGACCHIYDKSGMVKSQIDPLNYIFDESITVADLPPALLMQTLTEGEWSNIIRQSQLRLMFVGGEAVPKALVEQWYAQQFSCLLINAYGPTEGVITAISGAMSDRVTLGEFGPNRNGYIFDSELRPVPLGVVGELYIGGGCLARGYYQNTELTSANFIDNPNNTQVQERLYRTGDLVRQTADGALHYVGRVDDQVQLNGIRVELSEVEYNLTQLEWITSAAVILMRTDNASTDGKGLIAYICSEASDLNSHELTEQVRMQLKGSIPNYMIPAIVIAVPSLPINSNGKVDKMALPDPSGFKVSINANLPLSDSEQSLAEIWAKLLNISVEEIKQDSDFFMLGGHSLLSLRLIGEIRSTFNVEISIIDIFESSSLKEMADKIINSGCKPIRSPITPRAEEYERIPTSFSQQRLWFIDRFEGGSAQFNMPSAFKLKGIFNHEVAEKAFRELINRHEILRTVYVDSNYGVEQKVISNQCFEFYRQDLSFLSAEKQQELIKFAIEDDIQYEFNLAEDLMIKVTILTCSSVDTVILINVHHIAADGWSLDLIFNEFVNNYNALLSNDFHQLPPLEIQYADFAIWQRSWLESAEYFEQLDYWKKALIDLPPVHCLPLDRERPDSQSFNGDSHRFVLDEKISKDLIAFAQKNNITLFMLVHGLLAILLAKHSGQKDIVIGTPVANRAQKELEPMVGCFINTLVLRTQIEERASVREYFQSVKSVNLNALKHQDISFEHLVEQINPVRDVRYSPLFQILLNLESKVHSHQARMTGVEVENINDASVNAKYDLSLNVTQEEKLVFDFEYNTDLFDRDTVIRFGLHLDSLAKSVLNFSEGKLSDLVMLTSAEQYDLISTLNSAKSEIDTNQSIISLLSAQLAKTPDHIAAEFNDTAVTYSELHERVEQTAILLRSKGVQKGDLVGLYIDRGINMLVGLLGILKAGAAYVPLDPKFTKKRIEYIIQDSGLRVTLTSLLSEDYQWLAESSEVIHIEDSINSEYQPNDINQARAEEPSASDLAYLIYTSGSTGKPKAVAIEHGNATAMIHWASKSYTQDELKSVLASTALSFDLSVFELLVPICNGGSVCIVSDALSLIDAPYDHITLINTVPSVGRALYEHNALPKSVKVINLAGEALPPVLLRDLLALEGERRVCNLYGPSEATTYSTWASFDKATENTVPVGKPINGTQVYITDIFGQLAPKGSIGELYISGLGVARGYYNRPNLTHQSFTVDRFNRKYSQAMYKTGDLVCWSKDGQLEFKGRNDDQIKFNGFRIEAGEIVFQLEKHAHVVSAVVVKKNVSKLDDKQQSSNVLLVAYILIADHAAVSNELVIEELRAQLKDTLPSYMIPSTFVVLEELPLTLNGKVDKAALPEPNLTQSIDKLIAPSTVTEKFLADAWKAALGVDAIGIDQDFFALGGHSLLAVNMLSELANKLQLEIPLKSFFAKPTIEGLSSELILLCGGAEIAEALVEAYLHIANLSDADVNSLITHHGEEENISPNSVVK
ncbi:non-ribosomal peptide synthetase [Pseudoalteromonas sp. McH1-42]|uniref:non-ribosomal peptide synthetase n=1 Tax=Pseudoalteromonas sp. McH1-42 TaxID=2917752 RepID=UPI001EF70F10|nr:non-ribosomal peptide synthetase [Pseudoalteromonas sp. McH1-42]MCG7563275.1 amino acid adenylation domain-containing protein [Pseudoalteromonas sp. McH1-42]